MISDSWNIYSWYILLKGLKTLWKKSTIIILQTVFCIFISIIPQPIHHLEAGAVGESITCTQPASKYYVSLLYSIYPWGQVTVGQASFSPRDSLTYSVWSHKFKLVHLHDPPSGYYTGFSRVFFLFSKDHVKVDFKCIKCFLLELMKKHAIYHKTNLKIAKTEGIYQPNHPLDPSGLSEVWELLSSGAKGTDYFGSAW